MTAHLAGLPVEEVLPAVLAGGAALVTAFRALAARRPGGVGRSSQS